MAKKITRSDILTTATVMYMDITKGEVKEKEFSVLGLTKDNRNNLLELLRKENETDTIKLIVVKNQTEKEVLTTMDINDWYKYCNIEDARPIYPSQQKTEQND